LVLPQQPPQPAPQPPQPPQPPHHCPGVQVFVKTLTANITLSLQLCDSIDDVKNQIQDREGQS
jgi:hypothetical protein